MLVLYAHMYGASSEYETANRTTMYTCRLIQLVISAVGKCSVARSPLDLFSGSRLKAVKPEGRFVHSWSQHVTYDHCFTASQLLCVCTLTFVIHCSSSPLHSSSTPDSGEHSDSCAGSRMEEPGEVAFL